MRVRAELKAELLHRAQRQRVSLSRLIVERLTQAVDDRTNGFDEGYSSGHGEGEREGYARGQADGAARHFDRGRTEGDAVGFARGVRETQLSASWEGAVGGLIAGLLFARSGRNVDGALTAYIQKLRSQPRLIERVRDVVAQLRLTREFEHLLQHGRYVDPRVAEFVETLERIRRSA